MKHTYLITGATSDVGIALIRRLLPNFSDQDKIIACGKGNITLLAPLCSEYKGKLQTFEVDLTQRHALEMVLDLVENTAGVPNHIIHLPALPVVNTKYKNFSFLRFEQDMNVQLESALAITQRFLPKVAKEGYGRVLFMLSSYILAQPPKNTTAYLVVKQALLGLAKSLAAEYAGKGITVNCVSPSMMETKFLDSTPRLVVESSAQANPMGRNATPEDVVPAMEFLLSKEAGFITGVNLPITGGSVIV